MSKVSLFVVIGFLVITQILARSSDKNRQCGRSGDTCDSGCCNGLSCNSAGRCSSISKGTFNERRMSSGNTCGKHGDPCDQGCCDGLSCDIYARKCRVTITADMLNEQRKKLRPVGERIEREKQRDAQRKGYGSHVSVNNPAIGA